MCELRHTSLVVQKMTLRTERHLCPKTCPSLVLSPVLACPAFSWQVVAFSAGGDGGRRPREHDYLERWCGGRALPRHRGDVGFFGAHALSRCARVARMDSCDPLLATHFLLEKQVEARCFIRSPRRRGRAVAFRVDIWDDTGR